MRLLASAALPLVLATGCASSSHTEEELSRLRRDMATMKRDVAETKQGIERLESRVTLLALGRDQVQPELLKAPTTAPVATTRGPKRQSSNDRVLPVVRLGNKAEANPAAATDEGWVDPGATDDGGPAVSLKIRGDANDHERLPVDKEVLKKPDPVLGAAADEKASYDDALKLLREDGKPKEALTRFVAFREKYEKSKLSVNATYWMGECHFQLKAYENAIAELDALVRESPRSDKVPDALQRMGEGWLLLDNPSKGRALLERVIREFPETDAAQRAKSRLDSAGGH